MKVQGRQTRDRPMRRWLDRAWDDMYIHYDFFQIKFSKLTSEFFHA